MPEISILPEFLINKIAAGEVIERPASVVRELLDNSIDAGAKNVSVEVLYGGKKLIRVADDGVGMSREDASLSFERHATSKIKTEDDLFNISTLGFRGEALSSLTSVSKVTLITSTANSHTGTKIEIGAGQRKEINDAPPMSGTIIEVRDLFYNTPARRKFFKSTSTELSHIIEVVMQKALSYPGISFSLKHNNSELINAVSAKDIRERFKQLYGEELFNEFLEINPIRQNISNGVKRERNGLKLYGFVSTGNFTRSTRSYQFVFVNRRPVKNPTVSHAVYSAYRDLIPKDRHPAFFLFLEIEPGKVDVNVHPAKREVRFETPSEIHELVELAVQEALHPQQDKTAGDIPASAPAYKAAHTAENMSFSDQSVRETLESTFQSRVEPALPVGRSLPTAGGLQTDFFLERVAPAVHRYFYIGESFVAEAANNGLTIIDQHAAHERVLYEKFFRKTSIEAETLFLPIRTELSAREYNIVIKHRDFLKDLGLDVEDFGTNNVIVRTMPKELRKADIKGLLIDIASGIIEEETTGIRGDTGKQGLLENIAARLACHKSVRGSEPLNNEELSQLVADLEKCEVPDKCPHGRPTRIFISFDDLNRMFKRK